MSSPEALNYKNLVNYYYNSLYIYQNNKNCATWRDSFLFITWEQRKLGDYFEERNERSGEGELISVTINSGIKKFNELGRFVVRLRHQRQLIFMNKKT